MLRSAAVVVCSVCWFGCVADPVITDLALPDLSSAPGDALDATADLTATDANGIEDDLAPGDDLPALADLGSALPVWHESNEGPLGGELYGLAVTSSDVYVASLYDVFRSGPALSEFLRLPIPWGFVDGGINGIAASGATLYVALSRGRVLRGVGTTFDEITSPDFNGDKPGTDRNVNLIAARGRVAVYDGNALYEFDPFRMLPWRSLSTIPNAPTSTVNAICYSEDGLRLLVATDGGLFVFASDAWSTEAVTGASAPFLWVDSFGTGTAYREAVFGTGNVPAYYDGSWGGLPNTAPATSLVHLLIGPNDQMIFDAADGLYVLPSSTATNWTHAYNLPNAGFNQLAWSTDLLSFFATGPRGVYVTSPASLAGGTHRTDTITAVTINALAASSIATDRVYAATESGLFVSQDGGDTWFGTATPNFPIGSTPTRVATARPASGVLESVFAIASEMLMRSDDSGTTFTDLEAAHAVTTWGDNASRIGWVAYCPGQRGTLGAPKLSTAFGGAPVDIAGPTRCDELIALSDGSLLVTMGREIWRTTALSPSTPSMVMTGMMPAGKSALALAELYGSGSVLALSAGSPTAAELYVLPVAGAATGVPRPRAGVSLQAIATSPSEPSTFWIAAEGSVLIGDLAGSSTTYLAADTGLPGPNVTALLRSRSVANEGLAGLLARGTYRAQ